MGPGHRDAVMLIYYLELLAVFLAVKHFLSLLRNFHVLVRTDNVTAVVYINGHALHSITRNVEQGLLSLRATHIPDVLNNGTDSPARGNPLCSEWRLNPEVLHLVRERFG